MKKIMIAMAMVSMMATGVGSVSAQMVDIGTGQMEQPEFMALKFMVQGQQAEGVPFVATPLARMERYGLVEMSPEEFAALRNTVAGIGEDKGLAHKGNAAVQMVDIGTGEMPADEFAALKHKIKGHKNLVFDLLASLNQ